MTDKEKAIVDPPEYLRGMLPPVRRIVEALTSESLVWTPDQALYRAAYVPAAVLPERVLRAYRFGPPAELLDENGEFPFWWLYTADRPETAVWESGFCKNDVAQPGTFYFDSFALRHGVIAKLSFPRSLRLWNLNGEAASRLGIYNQLSSPDYEWSQWFRYRMFHAMQVAPTGERPDAFAYPSRKHRGHRAVAIGTSDDTEQNVVAARLVRRQIACAKENALARAPAHIDRGYAVPAHELLLD